MQTFNFYINVDQCLNRSDFDMFFYQQECEGRFHMCEASFDDERPDRSLDNAFHEIRRTIDTNAFLIRDFRLIFGIRQHRSLQVKWRETALYRELRIFYGLADANIFVHSREKTAKNVSILMLYDTDLHLAMPPLPNPDVVSDLDILLREAGILPEEYSELELYERLFYIAENGQHGGWEADAVTLRFLQAFFRTGEEELDPEEKRIAGEKNRPLSAKLVRLQNFLSNQLGDYCVFQKEIDANDLAENTLALLSVVEYITSDIPEKEKVSARTLRQASMVSWENASNDDSICRRYGAMMYHYKNALMKAREEIRAKEEAVGEGADPPGYVQAKDLDVSSDTHTDPVRDRIFEREMLRDLDRFYFATRRFSRAETSWKSAYTMLEDKMSALTDTLEVYAQGLSEEFRKELYARRRKREMNGITDTVCSREKTQAALDRITAEEREHREELRKQQLNASLRFQEELSLKNALKKGDVRIRFYAKCLSSVTAGAFFATLLAAGALFFLHYFVLQRYILSDPVQIQWTVLYLALIVVFYVVFWFAPVVFFRWKIRAVVRELKEEVGSYCDGYVRKFQNFRSYINELNQLDNLRGQEETLRKLLKQNDLNSEKLLWHKMEVERHLDKVSHFENMTRILDWELKNEKADEKGDIDFNRGVIDNRLYWPQKHAGEEQRP